MSVEAPQQGTRGYAPQGKDNGVVKSKGTVNVPLLEGQQPLEHRARKPEWLKVRAPGSPNYLRLKQLMRDQGLHTVCEEAHCPNIGECWESGTATFMILGDVCTRACKYCAVAHGLPTELDQDEPRRVADSVVTMGLEHAVVTSVNRDELKNGGAEIYAEVIRQIHARQPGCTVEVLVPDFKGNETALRIVVEAGPEILAHNIDTVERLSKHLRPGGRYWRSISMLGAVKRMNPRQLTKSAIILGMGETEEEIYRRCATCARRRWTCSRWASTCAPRSTTSPWTAGSRRTSSATGRKWASGSWASGTWRAGRWCARRTTPRSRRAPSRRRARAASRRSWKPTWTPPSSSTPPRPRCAPRVPRPCAPRPSSCSSGACSPMLPAAAARVTPEEYLAFERVSEAAHEYVDGVIGEERYSSRVHGLVATAIVVALHQGLRGSDAEVFPGSFRIRVPGDPNYLYSDAVAVERRAETEDWHDDSLLNPAIVVEVLWPSTEAYDRGRKWQMYREIPSLNHFVLVSTRRAHVEWYTRLDERRWLFREAQGLDAVVELERPRCTIRLADIYERVADLLAPGLTETR